MRTDTAVRRGNEGFTLIEVLVAMVLLAIGLLGLEALGVVAVRQTGLADRNSRSAAVATLYLEDALQQIRQGTIPQGCTNKVLPDGDQVTRVVVINTAPTVPSRVMVTVTPQPRGSTPRPFTVRSYVFSPTTPQTAGRACP